MKKFVICFLCVTLTLLIAVSSIVFCIDPFSYYRADDDVQNIIYQDPYYQNLGIATHSRFDTLITGSSMTQNFRANWFDDAYGCKAVRLSFDGGYTADYEILLKTALEHQPNLKTVYFGLDNYLLTADTALAEQTDRIPSFEKTGNHLHDAEYLLNKDVFFEKIRVFLGYKTSPDYNFYEMHAWGAEERDPSIFSREMLLSSFERIDKQPDRPEDLFQPQTEEFLQAIEPFVRDYPDVQFVFFAPPYSILYWYKQHQEGKLAGTIAALQTVYSKLLAYKNVRMFYFQNDMEKITNLDMYKDPNHYCTDYNKYMLSCFQSGAHEITVADYTETLDTMHRTILAYDFDALLNPES